MACAELQTLISAYAVGVVQPNYVEHGVTCTDYAAASTTVDISAPTATPTVGDNITITVQAYDEQGLAKTTGGDAVVIMA